MEGKIVWLGGSRRLVLESLCQTGKPRRARKGRVVVWEALAYVRLWFRDRHVGRVSLVVQQVRKGKVVWPGRLSPASDGRSRLAVSDR